MIKSGKYEINILTFSNFIVFLIVCGLYIGEVLSFEEFVFVGLVLANYGQFDNSFKKIPPRADRATPEGEVKE